MLRILKHPDHVVNLMSHEISSRGSSKGAFADDIRMGYKELLRADMNFGGHCATAVGTAS